MKSKTLPIILLLLLASLFSFANNGGKEKKEDPDLNGVVIEAETGKPLKDVNITAYSNSKKEKTVTSNASGNFSLADLKPGVYKFVFQKEGFEKVVREKMVLKQNEDYQLSIQMSEEENIFNMTPSPLHFNGAD
ncbi:MAG: carboxypeptidase-like regulatory domain-containing protein [Chitinophagaceae bacterium]